MTYYSLCDFTGGPFLASLPIPALWALLVSYNVIYGCFLVISSFTATPWSR